MGRPSIPSSAIHRASSFRTIDRLSVGRPTSPKKKKRCRTVCSNISRIKLKGGIERTGYPGFPSNQTPGHISSTQVTPTLTLYICVCIVHICIIYIDIYEANLSCIPRTTSSLLVYVYNNNNHWIRHNYYLLLPMESNSSLSPQVIYI